jgi:glycosyltransferase involved in cell wall biosynthesis
MDYKGKYYELCVLIPCYNNFHGLRKSLESISYDKEKYLIVIVDDGSNEAIEERNLLQDNKDGLPVHIIRLPENKGIVAALNTGLQWIINSITCTYIARLDCGDICDPQRFYKQINYLSVNTEICLLGSWCWFQNHEKKIKYGYRAPGHHNKIKKALYFRNVFIHPTIIFRYDILNKTGLYPENYPHAEDYAWFWKIANLKKTAIMPLYLVVCELNIKGISYSNRIKQLRSRIVIVKEFGSNFALQQLGVFKIKLLMKTPYSFVLRVKKLFSF